MSSFMVPLFKMRFLWWLILAAGLRLILMFLCLPVTDGYYFTSEGVSCLLSLKNPYEHTFTTIPLEFLTKGGQSVFAYLPFVPIFSLPFYLLGDVRYGFILCDLLIGYAINRINFGEGCRKALTSSLIYLFFPATVAWAVWAGANTNIGVAFLMLSLLFLQRKDEVKAGVFFGFSLAAIQFSIVLAPFLIFYSFKNGLRKFFMYSIAVCGLIITPFLLSDMRGMIDDVLLFNLTRQTLPVFVISSFTQAEFNLSINAFLFTFFGFTLSLLLRIAILLPVLVLLTKDCEDFNKTILRAFAFSTLFLFILLSNFLINYLILTLSLALIIRTTSRLALERKDEFQVKGN